MKILIIDDHVMIQLGLRRIFAEAFDRPTIGTARNSQEALHLLAEDQWDLVILDVDLPCRGGLDLLKQIKAERPRLPVIIFSMHSEEQFAIRALKGGASGYVSKDSDSERLVEAAQKVLRGGRYITASLAEQLARNLGRPASELPHEQLSDREFQVMRMIASGKNASAIADILSLSVKTVSTYRTRILGKLGLHSTADLIHYSIDHHLDQ